MTIVNTDPYVNQPAWRALSEKFKTNSEGVAYARIKYLNTPEYRHGNLWRLSRLIAAVALILCVIPCFTSRKMIAKLFQAARSGLDERVIRVAKKQNVTPNDPHSNDANPRDTLGVHTNSVEQPQAPKRKNVNLHLAKADGLINKNNLTLQEAGEEEVYRLQDGMQQTNPKYARLDLKKLDKTQLPSYKFTLGEVTYYCSKPFKIGSSHLCVLALVKIGDKVYPRIFYRSNSQASWRVLPAVAKIRYEYYFELGHFWKGLFESDTQLPIALNLALQDLIHVPPTAMYDKASDIVKTENHLQDTQDTYVENVIADKFGWMPVGAPETFAKAGMFLNIPPDPTKIKMPENQDLHPDFSVELAKKEFDDPHYGKIIARVYASKDKSLQFAFYEAEDGKVFLASVERIKNNPINPYGIRHKAVETKGMAAPLLEYYQQIPQEFEGGPGAPSYKSPKYQNNWNYVRELEIIQLYYAGKKLAMPEKLQSVAVGV